MSLKVRAHIISSALLIVATWSLSGEVMAQEAEAPTSLSMMQDGAPGDFVTYPSIQPPISYGEDGEHDVAIIVSIQRYKSLPMAVGAAQSSKDWYSFLGYQLGVPSAQIFKVSDDGAHPQAIRDKVRDALKLVSGKGRVWFIFIGHGATYSSPQGPAGALLGYEAPSDEAKDATQSALSINALKSTLLDGPQRQTILVLDASTERKVALRPHKAADTSAVKDKPLLTLSAAREGEAAKTLPGPTIKRAAFSYALLGAMRGWGDKNLDGGVTAREIERYTQRALKGLQSPQVSVSQGALWDEPLVKGAIEREPGFTERMQHTMRRADAIAQLSACAIKGQSRSVETRGQCCWPGQAYSDERQRCLGVPSCPAGMTLLNDGRCAATTKPTTSPQDDASCTSSLQCMQRADDAYYGLRGEQDIYKALSLYKTACDLKSAHSEQACVQQGHIYDYGDGGVPYDTARALELYTRACQSGVMDACTLLGDLYHGDPDVERDTDRAIKLYNKACRAGWSASCIRLGDMYYSGDGVSQDHAQAAIYYKKSNVHELTPAYIAFEHGEEEDPQKLAIAAPRYEKTCNSGHTESCYMLAHIYDEGLGVKQDIDRAATLYKITCNQGDMDACVGLGYLYHHKHNDSDTKKEAIQLFQRACDNDKQDGCYNIGIMYKNGEGVKQDHATAFEFFKRSCEKGHQLSCISLASYYDDGHITPKDTNKAIALYEAACADEYYQGCHNLGVTYHSSQEYEKALSNYTKSCSNDMFDSCVNLGSMYERGQGVDKDIQKSRELYKKACDAEQHQGCNNLALSLSESNNIKDQEIGLKLFKQNCDNKNLESCYNMGRIYLIGRGVKEDYPRALKIFASTCDEGLAISCNNLGVMYAHGFGTKQDSQRAIQLYERACNQEEMNGCDNLGAAYQYGKHVKKDIKRAAHYLDLGCKYGSTTSCKSLLYLCTIENPGDCDRAVAR